SANEGFTADYDLPNLSAYAETCASIGLVLWAHRLLQVDLDSRYADALERALYNGVLSGVSLDGESFFYENPLASQGLHHRQPWFDCACCPPNLARLLASLGQYVYGIADDALAVHLYVQSEARVTLAGQPVILRQTTDYPWQGRVALLLDLPTPTRFSLRLRLPGWSPGATLAVNGASLDLAGRVERGYIVIDREWRAGDEVVLDLPMPIERIYAHPDVRADVGRVALQRGPLVYCVEGVDHAAPLDRLALPVDAPLSAAFEADTLGGVVVVRGDALAAEAADWGDALYRPSPPRHAPTSLTAIPYYAWDNRAPGDMLVWLPQAP
ncbi:MAG: glycoside hydrolase family 127 protein, partial [Anaerolineae bacterium]|nr:glycoside hydrolase family 127 protein [Anaerolineae bacterium]